MTDVDVWTPRDHATVASQLLANLDELQITEQKEWAAELATAHALVAMALVQTEGGR